MKVRNAQSRTRRTVGELCGTVQSPKQGGVCTRHWCASIIPTTSIAMFAFWRRVCWVGWFYHWIYTFFTKVQGISIEKTCFMHVAVNWCSYLLTLVARRARRYGWSVVAENTHDNSSCSRTSRRTNSLQQTRRQHHEGSTKALLKYRLHFFVRYFVCIAHPFGLDSTKFVTVEGWRCGHIRWSHNFWKW